VLRRYHKVNFAALFKHGTVEFRHPAAVTDAHTITGWVLLYLKMVQYTKDHDFRQLLSQPHAEATARCAEALDRCVNSLAEGYTSLIAAADSLTGIQRVTVLQVAQHWYTKHGEVQEAAAHFQQLAAAGKNAFEVWSSDVRTAVPAHVRSPDAAGFAKLIQAQQLLQQVVPEHDWSSVTEPLQAAAEAAVSYAAAAGPTNLAEARSSVQQLLQGTHIWGPLQQLPAPQRAQLLPVVHWLQACCGPEEAGLMHWVVQQAGRYAWC
jgi:hypothetical protein